MDLYDRIRDRISGLTSTLKDMNTLTPDMHRNSDFSELYAAIENQMKQPPTAPAAQADAGSKSAENTKPASNVSAANNSIALGGIQIGGNVDGNITIGNNNKIDSK